MTSRRRTLRRRRRHEQHFDSARAGGQSGFHRHGGHLLAEPVEDGADGDLHRNREARRQRRNGDIHGRGHEPGDGAGHRGPWAPSPPRHWPQAATASPPSTAVTATTWAALAGDGRRWSAATRRPQPTLSSSANPSKSGRRSRLPRRSRGPRPPAKVTFKTGPRPSARRRSRKASRPSVRQRWRLERTRSPRCSAVIAPHTGSTSAQLAQKVQKKTKGNRGSEPCSGAAPHGRIDHLIGRRIAAGATSMPKRSTGVHLFSDPSGPTARSRLTSAGLDPSRITLDQLRGLCRGRRPRTHHRCGKGAAHVAGAR